MNWTRLLTDAIDYNYDVAGKLFDLVDDDTLDWKPATGQNWMTVGQLMRHITDACGKSCRGFVTGDWGLPEGMDFVDIPAEHMMPPAEAMPGVSGLDEAHALLAEDRQLALAMVKEAGEDALDQRMMAAPWDPSGMEKPLGAHLLGMVEHLAQHKGQLFYYLKMQGKPVSSHHLWGM